MMLIRLKRMPLPLVVIVIVIISQVTVNYTLRVVQPDITLMHNLPEALSTMLLLHQIIRFIAFVTVPWDIRVMITYFSFLLWLFGFYFSVLVYLVAWWNV